ncbi:DNA polymerase alpha-associated DNA helicase A [Iris pallida]|uniref:DNA polymerase alpha-associated DNA helicase A n=1 Tax=Iris pallida TaxID=29817 RepID=A0AAX6F4C0_IRIPA|nr:DNA polymerase alpha-associated DNA helicase A [Iris pallida]
MENAAATASYLCTGGGGGGASAAAKVFSTSSFRPWRIALSSSRPLFLNHAVPIRSSGGGSSSSTSIRRNSTNLPSPRPSSPPLSSRRKKKKRKDQETHNTQRRLQEEEEGECIPSAEETSINVQTLYQNGDPLGQRQIGKCVVRWICQGMRAMASDFASAEVEGEFSELRQRLGLSNNGLSSAAASASASAPVGGLAFVIQAQPYLYAVPMPKGLEALCFKACTHYPTLFDHFQRELRDILQGLQARSAIFPDWRATQSWMLLKEFANSAQHKAAVRKVSLSKPLHSGLGLELEKASIIQGKIEDFVKQMSDLLRIERDAELEFTQEELNAVSSPPNEKSNLKKPIEYLVSHGQSQQEQCDTICNLNAISSSTGLGGMHLVLFRVEGNHRLPPTTLSPGEMVCVRICNKRGAGATSCMQGYVNNLGEDGCSITVALESRHGDPTFSKLFGKSVRIDRIHGLADALTYERNCEALMLLQKHGLQKKNPSLAVVATLFGDREDLNCLEKTI